jgi:flagellar FliL protein
MADEEPELEEGEEGSEEDLTAGLSKKKFSGKKIVIIAIAAVLVLGGGAGGYFFFFASEEVVDEELMAENTPAVEEVFFYDLPDMLVNLNTGGRKASYLKVSVALEVASQSVIPEIESKLPRIIDNFQVYLRELRVEDLDGSAGMFRLKEELLRRVNASVSPVQVNDILFKEMLIQ